MVKPKFTNILSLSNTTTIKSLSFGVYGGLDKYQGMLCQKLTFFNEKKSCILLYFFLITDCYF